MIDDILRMPRDPAKVVADAAKMRAEIERHKPPQGRSTSSLGPAGWSTSNSRSMCSS